MSQHLNLGTNDAKQLNLTYLLVLQSAVLKDPASASYIFGIDAPTAEMLREKSYEELQALAFGQDRFVATFNYNAADLSDLFSRPAPLHRILSAVRHTPPDPPCPATPARTAPPSRSRGGIQ